MTGIEKNGCREELVNSSELQLLAITNGEIEKIYRLNKSN